MRYRATIRGEGTELRGYLEAPTTYALSAHARYLEPLGMLIASPAPDDYNPFRAADEERRAVLESELTIQMLQAEIAALRIVAKTAAMFLGTTAAGENSESVRLQAASRARALLVTMEHSTQAKHIIEKVPVILNAWVPGTTEDIDLRSGMELLASLPEEPE